MEDLSLRRGLEGLWLELQPTLPLLTVVLQLEYSLALEGIPQLQPCGSVEARHPVVLGWDRAQELEIWGSIPQPLLPLCVEDLVGQDDIDDQEIAEATRDRSPCWLSLDLRPSSR